MMSNLIERLRVTRLLSQRNQYALQADAADQLEAQQAEIVRLRGDLSKLEDANAVHVNMLRGTIAKPSLDAIIHIYGATQLRAALSAHSQREQKP